MRSEHSALSLLDLRITLRDCQLAVAFTDEDGTHLEALISVCLRPELVMWSVCGLWLVFPPLEKSHLVIKRDLTLESIIGLCHLCIFWGNFSF